MAPGDAVSAMLNDKVDAAFVPSPTSAIIELAGKGKSVLQSGEMQANHDCCIMAVNGSLIRDHPDLVEQIVRTHINATNYVNAHAEESARIYANKTGQPLSTVEYAIKTWDGKWISDPHELINSTLEDAKFQYEMNYTQKKLTKEDLFDTSFYDKLK